MRTTRFLLGLPMVGLFVIGCGGTGTSPVINSFAGNYSGNWDEYEEFGKPEPIAAGSATFSISEYGSITGTFTENKPISRTGNATGTIDADGSLTFYVSYPSGKANYSGKLEKSGIALDGTVREEKIDGARPFMHLLPVEI